MKSCSRLDPNHHVPVLIGRAGLTDAYARAKSESTVATNLDSILNIVMDSPLTCLHERYGLAAATQFLQPEDKWWIVNFDFDLDGMHMKRFCIIPGH